MCEREREREREREMWVGGYRQTARENKHPYCTVIIPIGPRSVTCISR